MPPPKVRFCVQCGKKTKLRKVAGVGPWACVNCFTAPPSLKSGQRECPGAECGNVLPTALTVCETLITRVIDGDYTFPQRFVANTQSSGLGGHHWFNIAFSVDGFSEACGSRRCHVEVAHGRCDVERRTATPCRGQHDHHPCPRRPRLEVVEEPAVQGRCQPAGCPHVYSPIVAGVDGCSICAAAVTPPRS